MAPAQRMTDHAASEVDRASATDDGSRARIGSPRTNRPEAAPPRRIVSTRRGTATNRRRTKPRSELTSKATSRPTWRAAIASTALQRATARPRATSTPPPAPLVGLRSASSIVCDICTGRTTFTPWTRLRSCEADSPTIPTRATAARVAGKMARNQWKARLAALVVMRSSTASRKILRPIPGHSATASSPAPTP
jgi:hypothetical protein